MIQGFASGVVRSWYLKINFYNFANPSFRPVAYPFMQVVWKPTTDLGCGIAMSSKRNYIYAVCDYLPTFNMKSDFASGIQAVKAVQKNSV